MRAKPVAEARNAIRTQTRRMLAQIIVERRGVAQRVLHAQRDAARVRLWFEHIENARAGEARQREDLAHVCVEPGAVFALDRNVEIDIDLVNDGGCRRAHIHTTLASTVNAAPKLSRTR